MKSLDLIIGSIILLVNIFIGLLITPFKPINITLTSTVIIITVALIHLLRTLKLKDAFKYSLSCLYVFTAIIQYVLCLFVSELTNNWCIVICVLLFAMEVISIIITKFNSKI